MMRAAAILGLTASTLWLAACSATSAPETIATAEPLPLATSPALRVAADLAAAQQAETIGDASALAAALSRLRNRGVHALEPEAEASLARWSATSGVDPAPLRGRALGPGFRRGKVAAGKSGTLEQLFFAGKPAEISLSGENRMRLRLTLRDAKTRVVCNHDPAAGRSCQFTPIFTQRYAIEIANGGQSDATYFLVFD